ncbi:MAG: hypothetical protein NTV16_01560 [Actinobacteria bacterium]|nr:hypothetical protein [Actinomycetota bacterium]
MAGKQGAGGGSRKIGNNKKHCEKYKTMEVRFKNKLKNFMKHNIPKNADENETKKLLNDFREIQKEHK